MANLLSEKCVLCNGRLDGVLNFPSLPLTGIYSSIGQDKGFKKFDQELLLCKQCGHGQLKHAITPQYLYGQNYGFRTSDSKTASDGARFFAGYLDKLFANRYFERIVEFGCNDAYLLKLLKNKGAQLLGIDLIWKGREAEFKDPKIRIMGDGIEKINLEQTMGGVPDLIISQHTMEHVQHPKDLLMKLVSEAGEKTIFLFEFPCFDLLLERIRFDQVFHQHLQYYSVRSFLGLLDHVNCELIDLKFNSSYWGSLLIAFQKSNKSKRPRQDIDLDRFPKITKDEINARYGIFRKQMEATKFALDCSDRDMLYGYGAALMLPVLGYHLNTDFSGFKAILDDDPRKDGWGYINLPVKIQFPKNLDFAELSICLTAMDNRRPILDKLFEKRPKNIINPLLYL